jgi:predicted tellurium resistance membrane protein TerC
MQDWIPFFKLLFSANVVFLFMIGVSLFLGDPSAETKVIIQITLVPICLSLLLSGFLIRKLR